MSFTMGDSMFKKLHDSGTATLMLYVDDQPVTAERGESVAAVLLRQQTPATRTTPVRESPRAPYCMMGVCFECLIGVDGVESMQACLVTVREGMRVTRQFGRRSVTP